MAPIEITRVKRETSGRYIIHLKETVSKADHLSDFITMRSGHSHATHVHWDSDILHGYAGVFDEATLEALCAHPHVKAIEEDGAVEPCATQTQTNAPWGLSRISRDGKVQGSAASLNYTYKYDSSAGNGVDIYIVGTIFTHFLPQVDFGSRAKLGAVFGSSQNVDTNGHGTHVAGTAGGTQYGVAKLQSNAVSVSSTDGSYGRSDRVDGLDFVAKAVAASQRPSVVNMSLTADPSTRAVDTAVNGVTGKGIHVTVAAGNYNSDAMNYTPARVPSAVTVGSMDIPDTKRATSNWGTAVDIFAPGGDITSTWIGSNTATNSISGTSMASPHVAGLIAYFIGRFGNKDVASMTALVKQYGIKDVIDASTLRASHPPLFALFLQI
ncbi:peptidase 1 [Amylostereum chailletii]|nr:peptidase 1 [Amylostereum chailletii]